MKLGFDGKRLVSDIDKLKKPSMTCLRGVARRPALRDNYRSPQRAGSNRRPRACACMQEIRI